MVRYLRLRQKGLSRRENFGRNSVAKNFDATFFRWRTNIFIEITNAAGSYRAYPVVTHTHYM